MKYQVVKQNRISREGDCEEVDKKEGHAEEWPVRVTQKGNEDKIKNTKCLNDRGQPFEKDPERV